MRALSKRYTSKIADDGAVVHGQPLARHPAETSRLRLQRTIGNQAVQRLLRTEPDPTSEAGAPRLAEAIQQGGAADGGGQLQRKPDVGFTVHSLKPSKGRLGNPDQTTPGTVVWPLDFAVPTPMSAEADVEVTGVPGDNCSAFELGFLQAVHSNSLQIDYVGQRPEDGTSIVKLNVDVPIRDGEPGSLWYEHTQNATASACGTHVKPSIGDYPTILSLDKVRVNSLTGQNNFFAAIKRTMGFVTTLVSSEPTAGVQPLRFFLWSLQMSMSFTPNFADVDAAWPSRWIENSVMLGEVFPGTDSTVPLFTTASDTYNAAVARLAPDITETK